MNTSATAAPAGSATRRWAAVAVLSASLLVITMDMTILNIAIPDMAADLRPASDQLLWIVDSYSLVLAGLLVTMSSIGDRWGRKRLLLTGYAVFGGASVLVLFAHSPEAVIAVRALLGVGGAMIMPTTLSMIRTVFTDPAERATALGIWAAVSGVGAAVGPIVGGLLLEFFSWRAAFLVNAPLMAIAFVAGALILPEARHPNPGRWDLVGAGLSLAGMVGLVWSFKHFAKQETLADADGWIVLLTALALLTLFVLRCLRRPDPLLDVRLFSSRPFTAAVVAALGATFALGAALLLLAQWMQLVEGASPIRTGVLLLPVAVAATVASVLAPLLARAIGARSVLAGGLAVAGVGMLALFVPSSPVYGHVLVALCLVGAGMGSLAIGSAMIMSGSPQEKAGSAAAIEETAYDLGSVLGVATLGSAAAVLYRSRLDADHLLDSLDPALADAARESLGSAIAVADQLGLPLLASEASAAFTESMQVTSLIGGLVMLAAAAVVFVTTPKGTDITRQSH
ncbi:MFS transporter [Nocardia puris]|uniref:DHA2 family multidrug resistance protein-like MFS transporter n=1 Tax=Nocardia puris TaxID=208602 RepID=A0A366E1L3_9NOCA|nr:MFS transporter [Nocardia puris]RBO96256.1 DHA2 family multidrug resistance protein-like MFS transporter [Nocardia puris]